MLPRPAADTAAGTFPFPAADNREDTSPADGTNRTAGHTGFPADRSRASAMPAHAERCPPAPRRKTAPGPVRARAGACPTHPPALLSAGKRRNRTARRLRPAAPAARRAIPPTRLPEGKSSPPRGSESRPGCDRRFPKRAPARSPGPPPRQAPPLPEPERAPARSSHFLS